MLEDLRALVEFAHAGSIAGAADRLFRTPSAITRQVQRLEAALGAELLDRSVKPPRLNSLGSRVLEQARDLLLRTEVLKSLTSSDAEPHGLLRIGLAHALAEGTLIEAIQALTEKYPKVRLRLSSELTSELIHRLLAGELDVAAVLLPEGKAAPAPLVTNIIASDRMEIVQSAVGNVGGDWEKLGPSTLGAQSARVLSSGEPHRSDGACRLHPNGCGRNPQHAYAAGVAFSPAMVSGCYPLALLPGIIRSTPCKYCVPRRLTCTDPSR